MHLHACTQCICMMHICMYVMDVCAYVHVHIFILPHLHVYATHTLMHTPCRGKGSPHEECPTSVVSTSTGGWNTQTHTCTHAHTCFHTHTHTLTRRLGIWGSDRCTVCAPIVGRRGGGKSKNASRSQRLKLC